MPIYIPLRVHSPFSIGFGATRLEATARFCAENAIPAAGMREEVGHVGIRDASMQTGVFPVAVPRARDVPGDAAHDPAPATALSNARFPWLSAKDIEFDMCPVTALRVAYTGALGWKLPRPTEMSVYLWDRLMAAADPSGGEAV